jgi:hypothetical protein
MPITTVGTALQSCSLQGVTMTKKFLTATGLVCALIAPAAASAAEITATPCNNSVKGCYSIMIQGDILKSDDEKFAKVVKDNNITTAIVNLNSYGGELFSGLKIGLAIKDNKFQTFVGDDWTCTSVCADMWLAGSTRYYGGAKSHIGFHGAFWAASDKSGRPAKNAKPQPDSAGNAVVGAYLMEIGLNYEAIFTLSEPGPDQIYWLTVDRANKLGIEFHKWGEVKVNPAVVKPGALPTYDNPNASRG